MRISALINWLNQMQEDFGDIEVVYVEEVDPGEYPCYDQEHDIETAIKNPRTDKVELR